MMKYKICVGFELWFVYSRTAAKTENRGSYTALAIHLFLCDVFAKTECNGYEYTVKLKTIVKDVMSDNSFMC